MKLKLKTLDGKAGSDIDLDEAVFGVPVRKDILQRMVEWHRAKKRAGTHKTKGISEIMGTTAKPYKQKGTGRARQGSLRSPQFRGGATIFGPVVRSHAYGLTKKFRQLGLKTALSAKLAEGKLHVMADVNLKEGKTKDIVSSFAKLGFGKTLVIDGSVNDSFAKAARNLYGVDVLPSIGANVYDILRHDDLILTQDAVKQLEARLK